nr:hypothetical protein [Tanacetum cinerariifolium]
SFSKEKTLLLNLNKDEKSGAARIKVVVGTVEVFGIAVTVPVTAIPKTSTVPTTTVAPTIQPFTPIPQQSTPTREPTTKPTTTLILAAPDFSSLFRFNNRVFSLEKELSQIKQTNPLFNRNLLTKATSSLTEFELKKILLDKMQKSKSYRATPEHIELYNGLVKSYNLDNDLFSSNGNAYSLKRNREDENKDEDPLAGSDQRLKK